MLKISEARNVPVESLRAGDWLVFTNPRFNRHIVEVERDGDTVTVRCNFGEGHPGMTSFYQVGEWVYIA